MFFLFLYVQAFCSSQYLEMYVKLNVIHFLYLCTYKGTKPERKWGMCVFTQWDSLLSRESGVKLKKGVYFFMLVCIKAINDVWRIKKMRKLMEANQVEWRKVLFFMPFMRNNLWSLVSKNYKASICRILVSHLPQQHLILMSQIN